MTSPFLIRPDNVSFLPCSQDVTRLSKSVKEFMRQPPNMVSSKSTSFETVVTVGSGSYRRERSRYASSASGYDRPLVNLINT